MALCIFQITQIEQKRRVSAYKARGRDGLIHQRPHPSGFVEAAQVMKAPQLQGSRLRDRVEAGGRKVRCRREGTGHGARIRKIVVKDRIRVVFNESAEIGQCGFKPTFGHG
ncbi:hypothetical protein WT24_02375 [Burkholderia sp. MSMB1078WGS]|nr:hypothetical protein WT24_02375 [Burkholderia sp. MSMB1078WGS]